MVVQGRRLFCASFAFALLILGGCAGAQATFGPGSGFNLPDGSIHSSTISVRC
jgi:hypothetical protein